MTGQWVPVPPAPECLIAEPDDPVERIDIERLVDQVERLEFRDTLQALGVHGGSCRLEGMPRAKADGITRASTGTMLRKQILPSPLIPSSRRGKDVASVATVFVTSEDPDHPIDYAFDGRRGPDGSRWIAGNVGEQTLILAFDAPQTIYKVVVDIDEPDVARTQEIDLSISDDGGQTYREILRQEYNFSPPNTTREHEEWSINADPISHLRLRIKPDKGANIGRATLTTLAIE